MFAFKKAFGLAAMCLVLGSGAGAWADTQAPADTQTPKDPTAELNPLSETELSERTGGQEISTLVLATSTATNNSNVADNTIGNIGATGLISSNTLSSNSGLTTLIANSGNQVSITQSTIVNIYLH